jgi:hypothetical protein
LNKNVWKSLTSDNINKKRKVLRTTLNIEQNVEFDLIKNLSEKLIVDKYNRNPAFLFIKKTKTGYSITRICREKQTVNCNWIIHINIDTNEAILSCNKECQHENPFRNKGLF